MIKKITAVLILIFMFAFPVCAEEDIYKQQFESGVGDKIYEGMPSETLEFLEENELSPENHEWVFKITPQNVFTHIFSFLKEGIKAPLVACLSILAIVLVSAAVSSNEMGGSVSKVTQYATVLSSAAVICVPVFSVVTAAANAMRGSTVFMTSFVPTFAVIVASNGAAATAASMSALLLGATQVVNYISNFAVMPLMSGYLSISIASSVSPILDKSGIADGIKKMSFWIMALLTTVTASVGLLKSSVGIYGVVACVVIFLPLLIELFLWRVGLNITSAVSDLFSVGKISALLRSVDSVISVLMGIVLLTLAMFVISLAVVITMGKVQ